MKKFACLGITALLAASMVGCSNNKAVSDVPQETEVVAQVETTSSESEQTKVLLLEDKDLEPFFKALFSFSEEQYNILNQYPSATYEGYFENLKTYRDEMKKTFDKFLTDERLALLKDQNVKLDFDLPKKVQINDYVVDAKGEVNEVKILSTRKLGEQYIYEVAVTTSNHVTPYNKFFEEYGWSDAIGYYQKRELGVDLSMYETSKHSEEVGYTLPNDENLVDAIKIKSVYWVYLVPDETFTDFKVDTVKQGGTYEVNNDVKQKLDNANFIERVPYYDAASDAEQVLIKKVVKAMMTQPEESCRYFEKVYNESFELLERYWTDLGIGNEIMISEETYQQAFAPSIIPYKDQDSKLTYEESKLQIVPSIYSTQLQPSFVVSIPMSVLEKDNEQKYFNYKYYIETEDGKVEAIKYLKRVEMTQEEYEAEPIVEEEQAEVAQADEAAQA